MNASRVSPSRAAGAIRLASLLALAALVAGAALLAAHGGASAATRTPAAATTTDAGAADAGAPDIRATDAGATGAATLDAFPRRFTVFQLGTIVPTSRPCATHYLVNPKGGKRRFALRGLLVDLERFEGRTHYVRGIRLGAGQRGLSCGGVPLVFVFDVDTLAR